MDILPLCHKVIYKPPMVVEVQGCLPNTVYRGGYPCSMNAAPNLGRYQASLEAVPSPWDLLPVV